MYVALSITTKPLGSFILIRVWISLSHVLLLFISQLNGHETNSLESCDVAYKYELYIYNSYGCVYVLLESLEKIL